MFYIRVFECGDCGHLWEVSFGVLRSAACPKCGSKDVFIPMYDETVDNDILDPHLFS